MSTAEEVKTDDVAQLSCLSTRPAVISIRIKLCFDIYDLTLMQEHAYMCVTVWNALRNSVVQPYLHCARPNLDLTVFAHAQLLTEVC